MGNIVLLDELTINKIAAGEVIERPASVVKELVENSVDAGATSICVEIKNGGISYIRVTDNGKGFARDDLQIAFERHATSKIRQAEDLETVKSMGFRGEALASIAAISKIELLTKTELDDVGSKIIVEGGNVLEVSETGCQKGTTITIENLFYNTPVRYKFLKKDFTEGGYIEDSITRLALINRDIAFKLISNGKTIIQTQGDGNIKNIIYSVYGKDVTDNILETSYEYEGIRITGVVGKPEIARSNRTNQLFFVNGRYVKDTTLSAATSQAFKGLITVGKFGFVILNLEMPAIKVDVNVHPAKLEVRFEEDDKVFQAVYHSIKETLLKMDYIQRLEIMGQVSNIGTTKTDWKVSEGVQSKEDRQAQTEQIKMEPEKPIDQPAKLPPETENIIEQLFNMKKNLEAGLNNPSDFTSFENNTDPVISAENNEVLSNEIQSVDVTQDVEEQQNTEDIKKETEELHQIEPVPEENKEEPQTENTSSDNATTYIEPDTHIELDKSTEFRLPSEEQIRKMTEKLAAKETNTEVSNEQALVDANTVLNEEQSTYEVKEQDTVVVPTTEKKEEPIALDFGKMYSKTFGTKFSSVEETEEDMLEREISNKNYKFVGVAFNTYIIIEIKDELYLIDQHAAHERILYEKVKENFYSDTNKDSQLMLIPDVITLSHKEKDIADDHIDLFEKAGFIMEEFGENSVKLIGVPSVCVELNTKELFLEILDEIDSVARTAKQELEDKFISTIACKAAIKGNMKITKEEVENLMVQILQLPNPFTCPHGRPTAIKLTKYEIERKFSRK